MTAVQTSEIAAEKSFIGGWYLEDPSICDQLIRLYASTPDKMIGAVGRNYDRQNVNLDIKDSTEALFQPDTADKVVQTYLAGLQKIVEKYVAEYPYCNEYAPWRIVEPINIQFYRKGGGFKVFHTERVSGLLPNATRHLVFMTYLNDVHDGGGTEFLYQNLTVSARKGLTLIWPADWTHTHRGIVSATEEKYIITGWFNFV